MSHNTFHLDTFLNQVTLCDKNLVLWLEFRNFLITVFTLHIILASFSFQILELKHDCVCYIEDITCPHMDMNFIFEYSTQYLSERRKLMRFGVEHEKIKFISKSRHVIFCLLHKHTNDDIFGNFPTISDHFPKIFENCSEGQMNNSEHFPNISKYFPKITTDCRRCFNHTSTNLSVVKETKEKSYQKGMISSQCER